MRTFSYPLFLAASLLTIFFFSCHDEQVPPSISGNWKLVELNGTGTIGAADLEHIKPDSFIYAYTSTGKDFDAVLKLDREPNVFSVSGQYTEMRSLDSMGTIIVENLIYNLGGNGEWYMEDDTLFFEDFTTSLKHEIVNLTNSELQLKEPIDYYQFNFNHMFPAHFEGTQIRTYKRN